MIKILAIGNSFSQDATRWFHQIAESGGIQTKVVNLYIGGCSLETHWHNADNDLPAYQYELNGVPTDRMVSIHEALIEERWDIVTLQQVSGKSGVLNSYSPYIQKLSAYAKLYAPSARQWIHQTWAYETDSDHPDFALYHNSQQEMYHAITLAYEAVAKDLGLSVIPCGEVIQTLRSRPLFTYNSGGKSLNRDGFHLDFLYGRYAAGATWYEKLLEGDIRESTFIPSSEGEKAHLEYIAVIKEVVHQVIHQ